MAAQRNWPRSRTEIFLSTEAILEIRSLGVRNLDIVELCVLLAQRERFIPTGVDVEKLNVQIGRVKKDLSSH